MRYFKKLRSSTFFFILFTVVSISVYAQQNDISKLPYGIDSLSIVVDTSNCYEPFLYTSEGELQGALIDIIDLWSTYSEVPIKFNTDFQRELNDSTMVSQGVHLQALMYSENSTSDIVYNFPILTLHDHFFYRISTAPVESFNGLNGKIIGVIADSPEKTLLEQQAPWAKLSVYENPKQMMNAVKAGDLEIFFVEKMVGEAWLSKIGLRSVFKCSKNSFKEVGIYLATTKSFFELSPIINKGVDKIQDWERQQIIRNWSAKYALGLSDKEFDYLMQKKEVTVGVDISWAPFEYVDDQAHFQGFSADILNEIEKITGLNIVPRYNEEWETTSSAFNRGDIDLLAATTAIDTDSFRAFYTKPYYKEQSAIFAHISADDYCDYSKLDHARVAIISGTKNLIRLHEEHPELVMEISVYGDQKEALLALSKKEVDFFVGNFLVAINTILNQNITSCKHVGNLPYFRDFCIGISPNTDQAQTLSVIIKKAFDAIPAKTLYDLKIKWFDRDQDKFIEYLSEKKRNEELKQLAFLVLFIFIFAAAMLFFMQTRRLKKVKNELFIAKTRAEESDRLKSEFLANMSHEIRTPLNAIVGFTELLVYSEVTEEERDEYIDTIAYSNDLLLKLINDIIDFARIESGSIVIDNTQFSMNSLIKAASESIGVSRLCKVPVKTDLPVVDASIFTDRNLLFQLITNLINNAAKFTDEGHIMVGYNETKFDVVCFVEDTGIGIPEEELSGIFDRFKKLNRFRQGTGLGLSIVHRIAENMSWKINVTSTLGKGTRFTISIPKKSV